MGETRSPSKEVSKYSFLYLMVESELLILTFFFQMAFFLILPHGKALFQEGLERRSLFYERQNKV